MKTFLAAGTSILSVVINKSIKGKKVILLEDLAISDGIVGSIDGNYSMVVIDSFRDSSGELRSKLRQGTVFEIDEDIRDVVINGQFTKLKGTRKIRAREMVNDREVAYIWFRFEGSQINAKSFIEGYLSIPPSLEVIRKFSTNVKLLGPVGKTGT